MENLSFRESLDFFNLAASSGRTLQYRMFKRQDPRSQRCVPSGITDFLQRYPKGSRCLAPASTPSILQ